MSSKSGISLMQNSVHEFCTQTSHHNYAMEYKCFEVAITVIVHSNSEYRFHEVKAIASWEI